MSAQADEAPPSEQMGSKVEVTEQPLSHFFRLARELRDLVYDELLENVSFTTAQGFKCQASNIAKAEHHLVSRQSSQELREASARTSKLVIFDTSLVGIREAGKCAEGLPLAAFQVKHLHVNVVHDHLDGAHGNAISFRKHIAWIDSVVTRMPNLKVLEVKAVAKREVQPKGYEGVWKQSKFARKKGLVSKLEVYVVVRRTLPTDHRIKYFDFEKQDDLRYRWSKEKGCLEQAKKEKAQEVVKKEDGGATKVA